MKNAMIKKEEIDILEWLDEYEAWDAAFKILAEHNAEPTLKKIDFYFNIEHKEWFTNDNSKSSLKLIAKYGKNTKNEDIISLCYELEFANNEIRFKSEDPKFDNLVEALMEGTKEFIKQYYV